jgi:uncharacterized membrane protein YtjA (UPF0391 family)
MRSSSSGSESELLGLIMCSPNHVFPWSSSEYHQAGARRTRKMAYLEGTNSVPAGYRIERIQAMSLLKWALIMLVVSLVAALFGFTDLAAASADVARVLFYIFLVIFLVLLVLGVMGARAVRGP